ncbi:MAG: HD domain-containing protein [Armatimonadetes bacterium]|nr:HD domain-containing protein [Armatimonadota bacterium]
MSSGDVGERLAQQLEFLVEIDKAKGILRRSYLMDQSRRENDAEHSWHIALMALVLCEHAAEPVDVTRVVKMLLVHDLVEIDAGDIAVYDLDEENQRRKDEQEQAAADRIFGLLPAEQGAEFRALWEEFEARETPEARFARALDRFQPMLQNYHTAGRTWQEVGVGADRVVALNQPILADGAPALEQYALRMLADAVEKGYLPAEAGEQG